MQYTCTSNEGTIGWQLGDDIELLDSTANTFQLNNFYLELTYDNGTKHLKSTATDERISSTLQGVILGCIGGSFTDVVTIDIAGR